VSNEREGRSLSIVHMQHEQWRRGSSLKVKEKEKDIVFNYVPKTRERSRGENPANTKKKKERRQHWLNQAIFSLSYGKQQLECAFCYHAAKT